MRISHPWLLALSLWSTAQALLPTTLLHQFDQGVWIENLAVREDGSILVTQLTPTPVIFQIDPLAPENRIKPKALYTFPPSSGVASLVGIAEGACDVFYVVGLNFTGAGAVAGSDRVFSFDPKSSQVKLLARIEEAKVLNGIAPVNDHLILVADTQLGLVWSINTETGAFKQAIQDPLVSPPSGEMGVNGVKIKGSTLYFTNTSKKLLAKVAIRPDGTKAADAVQIAPGVAKSPAKPAIYDDFALDSQGNAWVAAHDRNLIQRIRLADGYTVDVAGSLNSTAITQPTSAAFGRTAHDKHILYVVTGGGTVYVDGQAKTVGGQLVAINTKP